MEPPTAAVLIAALDEAGSIESVLETARSSSLVDEIIVADGGSTDGTREIVARLARADPRLRLVRNVHRHQAAGINLAARIAKADVVVRLDAHTEYADDYIDRSIREWRRDIAIGGPMRAVGDGPLPEAIANAMHDPLAIGPARFRHATSREEVDTVYLGCFERAAFLALGGYRIFPSGTVEDADFYFRWRSNGGKVIVDPDLRSEYRPRRSWRGLWRQYLRYGQGKAELLWINGRLPSPRAIAPAALVAGLAGGTAMSVLARPTAILVVVVPWAVVIATIGVRSPSRHWRTAAAAASMHVAYGLGMWMGLFRGRPRIRSLGFEGSAVPRT